MINVRKEENPKNLTTTIYITGKKRIHKIEYDPEGNKLLEVTLYCYCPGCKHLGSCDVGKMWFAKHFGRCDDFETE